ncbi:hypothetical protein BREV_BREV_03400 [Brevundimonas mediterranea]|uniref:Uncharacterized protein n=1 Tax=Brevundimonas mediterranea TaxID=74329 RepID=A0A7Z8Y1K5_9CAUL|nr:hypothetical protein BREV_BREV_03400 [Brevundimonas mediterranea]
MKRFLLGRGQNRVERLNAPHRIPPRLQRPLGRVGRTLAADRMARNAHDEAVKPSRRFRDHGASVAHRGRIGLEAGDVADPRCSRTPESRPCGRKYGGAGRAAGGGQDHGRAPGAAGSGLAGRGEDPGAGAAPYRRTGGGGPDGQHPWGDGGRDRRLSHPAAKPDRTEDADRGDHRGRLHPDDPGRPGSGGGGRRPVRRIPRAQPGRRPGAGPGAGDARGAAGGPAAAGHVGDAGRGGGVASAGRRAGDRGGGAGLSGRDPLSGAQSGRTVRRGDGAGLSDGAGRRDRLGAGLPAGAGGDPPGRAARQRAAAAAERRCGSAVRRAGPGGAGWGH